jgi:small-conductance mechanosensitive channel
MTEVLEGLTPYAWALGYVAVGLLVGWLLDWLVVRELGSVVGRRLGTLDTDASAHVAKAMRGTFVWLGLLLGAYFGVRQLTLSQSARDIVNGVLFVAGALVVTNAVTHLTIAVLRIYLSAKEGALPSTTVFEIIIKIVFYGAALLIVLSHFGVDITPLLAAAGVTGIVLGLALQETLTSLIAGVQIVAAGKIKVGDYISLESGEEGRVTDVNWRSAVVETVIGNEVIVPNSKLATTIVTNYEAPQTEFNVNVEVGVAYSSDLARVEEVTLDVARETIAAVEGTVEGFEPFFRYQGFGDSSIDFKVFMRVYEYEARYRLVHEFVKRLHARYDREGIEIPFPQRAVHMEPEG